MNELIETKRPRGRPRKAAVEAKKVETIVHSTVTKDQLPKRRRSVTRIYENEGHLAINTPEIPGFKLFWGEDLNPRRSNQLYKLTVKDDYDFVTPEEVGEQDNPFMRNGNRVAVQSGTHTLFLLKKPLQYFEEDKLRAALNDQATLLALKKGSSAQEAYDALMKDEKVAQQIASLPKGSIKELPEFSDTKFETNHNSLYSQ